MVRLLFCVIFVILSCQEALGVEIDCNNLIGTWSGISEEETLNSNKVFFSTFRENGTFSIDFSFTSKQTDIRQVEQGYWTCENDLVALNTRKVKTEDVNYIELYRYIELTPTYRKYQTVLESCDVIVGDCNGKIYESVKIELD